MTVRAERFLGPLPLGKRKVPAGEAFFYCVTGIHGSINTPVGIELKILSGDEVDDTRDISAVNRELGGRRDGAPNTLRFTREKQEITECIPPIPGRLPGLRTEFKWYEPTLDDRMADVFFDLAEGGKFGLELELLRITQTYEGLEATVRLSKEFKERLHQSGADIPRLSVSDGREIEVKVGVEFLKNLGISPKGLLGDWRNDEQIWMPEYGSYRIKRTKEENPSNKWDPPVIVYTLQADLTAD